MKLTFCCACGSTEGLEHHHLLPRGDGGEDHETNLITLCFLCHGKVHGMVRRDIKRLVTEGIARAKARGVKFGSRGALNLKNACPQKMEGIRLKGTAKLKERSDAFALTVYPRMKELLNQGKTMAQIAIIFDAEGISTLRGNGKWSKSQLFRYLYRVEGTKKGSPKAP